MSFKQSLIIIFKQIQNLQCTSNILKFKRIMIQNHKNEGYPPKHKVKVEGYDLK